MPHHVHFLNIEAIPSLRPPQSWSKEFEDWVIMVGITVNVYFCSRCEEFGKPFGIFNNDYLYKSLEVGVSLSMHSSCILCADSKWENDREFNFSLHGLSCIPCLWSQSFQTEDIDMSYTIGKLRSNTVKTPYCHTNSRGGMTRGWGSALETSNCHNFLNTNPIYKIWSGILWRTPPSPIKISKQYTTPKLHKWANLWQIYTHKKVFYSIVMC